MRDVKNVLKNFIVITNPQSLMLRPNTLVGPGKPALSPPSGSEQNVRGRRSLHLRVDGREGVKKIRRSRLGSNQRHSPSRDRSPILSFGLTTLPLWRKVSFSPVRVGRTGGAAGIKLT